MRCTSRRRRGIEMILGGLFHDKQEKISGKRVFGGILVVSGIVLTVMGEGDPETVRTMIWAGVAGLGVGTLETKVSK
jgi:drug/metabolite transporter (DMT)-like permease